MNTPKPIALATSADCYPLNADDQLLADALTSRGVHCETAVWDQPQDWSRYRGVIIRSCWDYTAKLPQFLGWITHVEQLGVTMWNSPAVLRENVDKHYLQRLEQAGIPVVPTLWIEPGESGDLQVLIRSSGWTEAVLKPAVSAGSRNTVRGVTHANAREHAELLTNILQHSSAMLQPFIPEICTEGEWSLMFFGGEFSHAVVKRPASGDYRVQVQFGGTTVQTQPPPEYLGIARRALQLLAPDHLYARVDGVTISGKFHIMEVELTEPCLFFEKSEPAADQLADLVVARCGELK